MPADVVTPPWRAGYAALAERVHAAPEMVRAVLAAPPVTPLDLGDAAGIVVTGVGSSAAHARLLVHLLCEHLGLRARYRPLGAFVAPVAAAVPEALIVISQGVSPNARLALASPRAWSRVVLLTAATVTGARRARKDDKARFLVALGAAGVEVRAFGAGEEEYGTLLRISGPLAGYVAVIRLAQAVATALGRALSPALDDLARVPERMAAAPARVDALVASDDHLIERLGGPLVLVACGAYGDLVDNLRYKVLEGMLRPLPPVLDAVEVAHGPFQQFYDRPMTLLALTGGDPSIEAGPLAGLARMLVPGRHRLVPLPATLPGPLAIFEHEAMLNELVLRFVAAHEIDQALWPGRGADAPLYELGADTMPSVPAPDGGRGPSIPGVSAVGTSPAGSGAGDVPAAAEQRLAVLAWPEVEALLAAGPRTAVVPLGSTEQHGPHLPLATDTWIADELGRRVCAAMPEAILLPALPFGCASEHLAFPGTLDVGPATLAAILADLVRSLGAHGFAYALIFSAHGGNVVALARALPALRRAAAPMTVIAQTDLSRLATLWHDASAKEGVDPVAAGHHAGEHETSIVTAIRPEAVRTHLLAPGYVSSTADPQALFYPSLRDHAPTGTVGDPRAATAAHGSRYLDAWAALLVSTYRLEKKSP